MTAPVISVDQWPEGAVALMWSTSGLGKWIVADASSGTWEVERADIPMPAGHDWRVPVMRPSAGQDKPVAWMRRSVTYRPCESRFESEHIVSEMKVYRDDIPLYSAPQPAPAINLEQFRQSVAAEFSLSQALRAQGAISGTEMDAAEAKRNRLLALIDGQPTKGEEVAGG